VNNNTNETPVIGNKAYLTDVLTSDGKFTTEAYSVDLPEPRGAKVAGLGRVGGIQAAQ
jgi:hypothetical protein